MTKKLVKRIAVYHGKGGVGKTTTTGNIACWLARQGFRVLAIDADHSANLTSWLLKIKPEKTENEENKHDEPKIRELKPEETLMGVFQGRKAKEIICQSIEPNLELIPSIFDLAAYEPVIDQKMARETILRKALEPVQNDYDFILIDSKPGVTVISRNVLCAVDEVIIPVDATFAVNDLEQVFEVFTAVHESGLNPRLQIRGVLITKDKKNTKLSKNIRSIIKTKYSPKYGDIKIFDTVIPDNSDLKYCIPEHQSIYEYNPESNGAKAYGELSEYLVTKWGKK